MLSERRVRLEKVNRYSAKKTGWVKQKEIEHLTVDGEENRNFVPPAYIDLPNSIHHDDVKQILMQKALYDLNEKITFDEIDIGPLDLYYQNSIDLQKNDDSTHESATIALKKSLLDQQTRLIEYMYETVHKFELPPDIKNQKKVRKIMIPQDEYPGYNFMGLIIGPRGCNHKRLELESGAQISIRGYGTQKGIRKSDHQTVYEVKMPQHIHITADTEEKVEKAMALIEPLLDPTHPVHEEYRKKGLQQLAEIVNKDDSKDINTMALMRSQAVCSLCDEKGHYNYECPHIQPETFERNEAVCLICAEKGHATKDCPVIIEKNMTPQEVAKLVASHTKLSDLTHVRHPGYTELGYTKANTKY